MARRMNPAVWGRYWTIARPYFLSSEERGSARALVAVLVLLLGAQTAFNVLYVAQTGEFMSALAAQDSERFWRTIAFTVLALLASVPCYAFYYYTRDKLGVRWRRWLTHQLLTQYLCDRAYYKITGSEIDNPDQRISEDARAFTHDSLFFLLIFLSALLQLIAFTGVLWAISRELVVVLLAYAIIGNYVVMRFFGRRLIALNFHQLRREADFRFDLVRVRENAEPIAFQHGEGHERTQAQRYFAHVFGNFNRIVRAQLDLGFFQYSFSFLALVLPTVVIASRVLSGELEVGRAVQAGGAFAAVLAAMTLVIDRFTELSKFVAGVDRLDSFMRALRGERGPDRQPTPAIETRHDPTLRLEELTVQTPAGERTLIRDLSLVVEPGRGLMIVGGSGNGKTSLLRAISGLWTTGQGVIHRPSSEHMMFLPQTPYMAPGTLREQILYPDTERAVPDEELRILLRRVNLGDLEERVGGLGADRDWAKVLSVGEQQRLAFTRALLAEPHYVMLDEATSALDPENEAQLYRELAKSRLTPVSVSHRPALRPFHADVLELPGDTSWRLSSAESYRFDGEEARQSAAAAGE